MNKLESFVNIVKEDPLYRNLEIVQDTQKSYRILDFSANQPAFLHTRVVVLAESLGVLCYMDYDSERKQVFLRVYC
jgi:hypothetical protein